MMQNNPWLGLKSYEENDLLYGRGKESEELVNIIINSFHTIIYGKSGIGKTSLLRAGVFPTLRYEDFLPIYIRLEHKENAESDYYQRQIDEIISISALGVTVEKSEKDINSLSDVFSKYTFCKSRGIELMPVFVFDQFEEIFTLNECGESEAVNHFFSDLSNILNNDNDGLNFRIVICLREDYLYYIERLSESIPAFKRNRYCLQNLTCDEALEVVTKPCVGLVDDIVAQEILHKLSIEKSGEVNAMILSLYMSQLYEKMVKSGNNVISSLLVRQFGDNIISAFYFDSIEEVSEKAIEYLEDHLVTTGGYRRNVPLDDAITDGVKQSEINHLKERRILNIQPLQGNVLYMEYVHDVLCPIIVSNRDKRTLRKKTKRLRRMVATWVTFVLLMASVALGLRWQAVQIKQQNRALEITRDSLVLSNKTVLREKKEKDIANDSLLREKKEKDIANDSLLRARLYLAMRNKDLTEINEQLKKEKDNVLKKNQMMLMMQSRAIASQVEKLRKEGEFVKGVALCLKALPENLNNPDRPISYEALNTLYSLFSDFSDCKRIIKNKKSISFASFSPDGKYIITASIDSTTKIWNTETGKLLRTIKNYKAGVGQATYSPDGKIILAVSFDSTLWLWNAKTLELIRSIKDDEGLDGRALFTSDSKYLCAKTEGNDKVKIWNISTGKLINTIRHKGRDMNGFLLSNDGKIATYDEWSGEITLYDVLKSQSVEKNIYLEGTRRLKSLTISPDGKYFVACENNRNIVYYDINTGEEIRRIEGSKSDYICSFSFSYDGHYIVALLGKLIYKGEHSLTNTSVESWITDQAILILNAETGERIKFLQGHSGSIFSATFSPDNTCLLSASSDGTAILWNLNEVHNKSYNGYSTNVSPMSFTSNAQNLVFYGSHYKSDCIVNINLNNGQYMKNCIENKDNFSDGKSFSLSPDGKIFLFRSDNDYFVNMWDVSADTLIHKLDVGSIVTSAFFSPNGRFIVTSTSSRHRNVIIWDAKTKRLVNSLEGHKAGVNFASFSYDNRYIVTASKDSTVMIWSVENGGLLKTLKGHKGKVNTASFSPDNHYVVTASEDSTAIIWSVDEGKVVKVLKGHKGYVKSAFFSPDGRYVVSACARDNKVKIWDVSSGIPFLTIDHRDVSSATFTPDGRNIVICSDRDNTLKVEMFMEPQRLIDRLRALVGDYQFTPEEEIKYYLK